MTPKNRDFIYGTFVSYICQQRNFFEEWNRNGIKNIFHNI